MLFWAQAMMPSHLPTFQHTPSPIDLPLLSPDDVTRHVPILPFNPAPEIRNESKFDPSSVVEGRANLLSSTQEPGKTSLAGHSEPKHEGSEEQKEDEEFMVAEALFDLANMGRMKGGVDKNSILDDDVGVEEEESDQDSGQHVPGSAGDEPLEEEEQIDQIKAGRGRWGRGRSRGRGRGRASRGVAGRKRGANWRPGKPSQGGGSRKRSAVEEAGCYNDEGEAEGGDLNDPDYSQDELEYGVRAGGRAKTRFRSCEVEKAAGGNQRSMSHSPYLHGDMGAVPMHGLMHSRLGPGRGMLAATDRMQMSQRPKAVPAEDHHIASSPNSPNRLPWAGSGSLEMPLHGMSMHHVPWMMPSGMPPPHMGLMGPGGVAMLNHAMFSRLMAGGRRASGVSHAEHTVPAARSNSINAATGEPGVVTLGASGEEAAGPARHSNPALQNRCAMHVRIAHFISAQRLKEGEASEEATAAAVPHASGRMSIAADDSQDLGLTGTVLPHSSTLPEVAEESVNRSKGNELAEGSGDDAIHACGSSVEEKGGIGEPHALEKVASATSFEGVNTGRDSIVPKDSKQFKMNGLREDLTACARTFQYAAAVQQQLKQQAAASDVKSLKAAQESGARRPAGGSRAPEPVQKQQDQPAHHGHVPPGFPYGMPLHVAAAMQSGGLFSMQGYHAQQAAAVAAAAKMATAAAGSGGSNPSGPYPLNPAQGGVPGNAAMFPFPGMPFNAAGMPPGFAAAMAAAAAAQATMGAGPQQPPSSHGPPYLRPPFSFPSVAGARPDPAVMRRIQGAIAQELGNRAAMAAHASAPSAPPPTKR
ncbi:hypothetical protein CEUSTIGMA_g6396.t1 [Chlamydomonas eustigma]|uniref:Uncharacterized protein n=1 Tax=Chlamydomonas eustigma TaxID=1157962 RepID=A0A250X7C8_9CHLO|nr:hypothetical protein CEUSTIGMA_g6396.t1 [Chlamydomonas eustigma]|eukprot:GAX78956.1 hypothetical protein CEUSTIGMA_g6396.t1 [Chlamydomonas eustigma]